MQPYQEASEEFSKQSYRPIQAATAVAAPAFKAAVGGRIMSMLNKYVPPGLAAKGLAKIDPRLGKFLSLGQEAGHSYDELKDFITDKVGQGEKQEEAKQQRNIIEQESPELHQFIGQEIGKGKKPHEAAFIASTFPKFRNIINKLKKTHNLQWGDIIEQIYGKGDKGLPKPNESQQAMEQPQQAQTQQPQQGGAPGQGQQALMAILQKINQKLGQ